MTDRIQTERHTQPESSPGCHAFEQQLSDYLEGALAPSARADMDAHRLGCMACDTLVRDLEELVQQAGTLPVLTPTRDLWQGIASQLATDVVPLAAPAGTPVHSARRTVSVRAFAIAAALLVTVTSAVTWRLARIRPSQGQAPVEFAERTAPSVPTQNALDRSVGSTSNIGNPANVDDAIPATLVAASPADVDEIYEREITSLRTIVNERFSELDSTTVNALRRNLAIIDAAIADSRKALERDPNSRLLSSQLDRALETKLALMRRVALL